MNILVASGKGGTGKTIFTSLLSVELSKSIDIVAVDADVDTPNLHILLKARFYGEKPVYQRKAFARKNAEECKCPFGAVKKKGDIYYVDTKLCEGCGFCEELCKGYELRDVLSGYIKWGNTEYGFPIVSGFLKPGFSGSGDIVDKAIRKAMDIGDNLVIDAAAGIGCPVISAFKFADIVFFVVESTKQSKNGFERIVRVANHFGVPWYVIENKYNLNYKIKFPKVIAKVPYTKNVSKSLSNLELPREIFKDALRAVLNILKKRHFI